MRYISIFSGIEAATVAWERLGWTPVAFAEIDAFPSAVLAARYPDVPNLGDVTKVDWSPYRGAVDLVVGGSPCQSFSVAGKREGLSGASGLMWEYIRCVQEVMPSWFIWENVPGALTVERGRAFAQLLDSLDELGYGLAWRILDAQFVRVPSRGGGSAPSLNDAGVSFLSDTLETCVPARFCLSPKACAGIIRRAERRGKPLPEPLGEVLHLVAAREVA